MTGINPFGHSNSKGRPPDASHTGSTATRNDGRSTDPVSQALAEAEDRMHVIIHSLKAEVAHAFQETLHGTSKVDVIPLGQSRTEGNVVQLDSLPPKGSDVGADDDHGDSLSITEVLSLNSQSPSVCMPTPPKDAAPRFTASMTPGWPENIQLRAELARTFMSTEKLKDVSAWDLDAMFNKGTGQEGKNWRNPMDTWVLHPDSRRRRFFDAVSLITLVVDAVFTPYSMTFGLENHNLSILIMSIIAGFWFLDLCLSFVTGFHTKNGEIELRFSRVARHYFSTTLVLDLTCVAVDFTSIASAVTDQHGSSMGGLARVLRVAKIQRFIRIFSVFRIFRVMKKLSDFMEAQVSQSWRMVVLVCQLTLLLMWICHIFACVWYSIGEWAPTGRIDLRWLDMPLLGELGGVRDQEDVYIYISAYHWSLAQITLGGTDITAISVWERIFTMFCNLFGLIFGGALVSILSTTLIELRELNQEKNSKLAVLKEFLSENNVSLSVRLRVLGQVHDRVHSRDKVIVEKDVHALQVVSRALVRELRFAVFSPHMLKHPLFLSWESINSDAVKIMCSNGLAFMNIRHEDELFAAATPSHRALYLLDGSITYSQSPRDGFVLEEQSTDVAPNTWMCEATWWCHWVHVGDAFGTGISSILSVSPEAVASVLGRNSNVHAVTVEYAKRFHEQVVQPPHDSQPTDLEVACTSFRDLIGSSSQETHLIVGLSALEHTLQHSYIWKLERKDSIRKLVDEIRSGTSLVLLTPEGLQRSVLVTCVEFTNACGEILLEVADYGQGGKWKPCARLPGAKRLAGETFSDTFERFFSTHMSSLRDQVVHYDVYQKEEAQDSEHFGIGTIYNKTICVIRSTPEIDEGMKKLAVTIEHPRSMDDEGPGPLAVQKFLTEAGNALSLKAEGEEFAQELKGISTVYILSGSSHTSMYVWLNRTVYNDLKKYEPFIKKWASSFTELLPGREAAETEETVVFNI